MTATSFPAWYAFMERPENDGQSNDTAISNAGTGDGAGETHWGWTYPTWREEAHRMGIPDLSLANFRAQTPATLQPLARDMFWSRLRCDEMSAGVDCMVADWAFTSGGAVLEIQRRIGALADGLIGPATLAALAAHRATDLVTSLNVWRAAYYDKCGFRALWPGLYRRSSDCTKVALGLVGTTGAASNTTVTTNIVTHVSQPIVNPPPIGHNSDNSADALMSKELSQIQENQ